ncbi:MAG: dethiobiotin synthase [Lachnospiraceae bacterium]|nr:dethiobiotin synthase [Lachnospiraceae bacterium]MDE6252501.1 dethiobiotin synthase [Lachnospiraceae bacterium]
MSKSLFVTGTNTDIGKTYVTALIVKKLRDSGLNAGYFKAAVSGNERTENGIIPGDAEYVDYIAGIGGNLSEMVPYVYENAYSPHLASQIEGNPVEMSVVGDKYNSILQKYDYVTVEGSGGIICPIRYDDKIIMLEDIVKELGLSTLIIADAGLGTINSVFLTVNYMKSRDIKIKGIILNHFHEDNIIEQDNKKMIEILTGVPVVGVVHDNDENLDMDAERLAGLYDRNRKDLEVK